MRAPKTDIVVAVLCVTATVVVMALIAVIWLILRGSTCVN